MKIKLKNEQLKAAANYNLEVSKQLYTVGGTTLAQLYSSGNLSKLKEANESSFIAVKNLASYIGAVSEALVGAVLGNAHLAFIPKAVYFHFKKSFSFFIF
jgi:hypothetical protein